MQELPVAPVIAEDGRIYDKPAIKQYYQTKPGNVKVPSPMTQVLMGKKLLPAPNIKSHIESMVTNGYIEGQLADKWKENVSLKKKLGELMEKAGKKQPLSRVDMKLLAEWCVVGNAELGFERNFKMALELFETLHVSGDPEGSAHLGRMFYRGLGTSPKTQKGLVYLGIARGLGSSLGAFFLADCFANPEAGLPIDVAEACFFYKLSLRLKQREDNSCEDKTRRGLSPDDVLTARQKIAELMKEIPHAGADITNWTPF